MELKSIKDYRKHIKEIKQGFREPKTPPKLTEKQKQDLKMEQLKKDDEEARRKLKEESDPSPKEEPLVVDSPGIYIRKKPKTSEELAAHNERVVQHKL